MRIVVTGGRAFANAARVFEVLDAIRDKFGVESLAQGGAAGLDTLVHTWAVRTGTPCVTYEAEWRRKGAAAGPIRNRRMLEIERPDLVLAFSGGSGTQNCAMIAVELGLPLVWTTGKTVPQIVAEIEGIT